MRPPWQGDWNAVRYRPDAGDHVESYFLKATAPDAQRAVWLKATILATAAEPDRAVAEAWAIAFDHRGAEPRRIAVKHTVPLREASFSDQKLAVDWQVASSAEEMYLRSNESHGAIATGSDRIAWDLKLEGAERPLVHYPYRWMYTGPLPSQKIVSPHPDLRLSGHVLVGEERWELAQWRGMQGHNWGRGHSELYVWFHCNQWDQDADFVLDGTSGRVRVGPVLMPVLSTICVRHGDDEVRFNHPRQLVGTRADIGLRRFTFSTESRQGKLEGLLEAKLDEFVGLNYANPKGPVTQCLNSKLARGRIRFEPQGKPPLDLTTKAAALEVGTFRPDHGVKMFA